MINKGIPIECSLFAFGLGVIHSLIVKLVYTVEPDPYMDEIFHINQTRAYCRYEFASWNPKITTPPGLYLLALPMFCGGTERYLNSLLFPLCFLGLFKLRQKLVPSSENFEAALTSLIVVCLPVMLDTSFLFYTDLLSLTCVVWGLSHDNPKNAFLCFFIGVLTRQTNVVWAGMYCFLAWVQAFNKNKPVSSTLKCVYKHSGFVVLFVLFVAFVFFNKGVVLGDRSAHKPILNLMQFFYFLGFLAFSTLPVFIYNLLNYRSGFLPHMTQRPLLVALILGLCIAVIKAFTITHPYTLADSRHFTFHLWSFFTRHWMSKFALAPLYTLSIFFLFSKLTETMAKSFVFIFLLSTCMCIIPHYLFEFRYFIVPFALWRLTVVEKCQVALYAELAFTMLINFVAMHLFINSPFEWPTEPNVAQRFMW